GKKLHVSKQFMSIHSPVFKRMLCGSLTTRNMKIEIKDVDYQEFVEFLNVIYPSFQKITDDNALETRSSL
ncbi:hypothetical protein PFISCL1PPCAC_3908, partial [Pristionchus fissidentatus]